jgi:organic radical activating enzyme
MACAYCDEERLSGAVAYSPKGLLAKVKDLDTAKGPHHSVSLTGGEPLLYADFLAAFLPLLGGAHLKTYLETNGTLPHALSRLIDYIDIVAMDIKLPSATGGRAYWKEHYGFLKIAAGKKVFVKSVVTNHTAMEDIVRTAMLIKKVGKTIPLVLQPATPLNDTEKPVDKGVLLKFMNAAMRKRLDNVRVLPQAHKILNIK